MNRVESFADVAVAMTAPIEWFDDDHRRQPRCCTAIRCVAISLAAIGTFDEADARELAREVVAGFLGAERRT